MNRYYLIFGAAVRPDGQPSGTLARRVEGEVMRRMLLEAGVAPEAPFRGWGLRR